MKLHVYWLPITGVSLGVEWMEEEKWIVISLVILRFLVCYGSELPE